MAVVEDLERLRDRGRRSAASGPRRRAALLSRVRSAWDNLTTAAAAARIIPPRRLVQNRMSADGRPEPRTAVRHPDRRRPRRRGIIGFFYDASFDTGTGEADDVFGVLAVNGWHNIVHILTGALGLLVAGLRRPRATRSGSASSTWRVAVCRLRPPRRRRHRLDPRADPGQHRGQRPATWCSACSASAPGWRTPRQRRAARGRRAASELA